MQHLPPAWRGSALDLFSALPAPLSLWAGVLVQLLDRRTAPRLALLFVGLLFARGRRTVTSWFRPAYGSLHACGRNTDGLARAALGQSLLPLWRDLPRLVFALDDTPTRRYGPEVEGAGLHHNPTPGPSHAPYCYCHLWITLAWLAHHPVWGSVALPQLPRRYRWPFRTKLALANDLLGGRGSSECWASRCGW